MDHLYANNPPINVNYCTVQLHNSMHPTTIQTYQPTKIPRTDKLMRPIPFPRQSSTIVFNFHE